MNATELQDWIEQPVKYTRFKTARMAQTTFNEDHTKDIDQGEVVGVKYAGCCINHLTRRVEPLYEVTAPATDCKPERKATMYGHGLTDFVL